MVRPPWPFALIPYLLFSLVGAYDWTINNAPSQCGTLSVSVSGTDGQPPYSLLLMPYGATPLADNVEVRRVETIHFNTTSENLEFQMRYPANSQFVAVVSDQSGFASGGTSGVWTVKPSTDNSCFDSKTTFHPAWPYFYIYPSNGINSCEVTEVYWNASNPNITGTPNFIGVIPNGISWNISYSSTFHNDTGYGNGITGFDWTVPVNPGTDLIVIAGDQNYTGSGGNVDFKVSPPTVPTNTNCYPNMPSATGGTPAGGNPGAYLSTSLPGSDKNSHTGAIAGGVVGGVVGIALLFGAIFFFIRRSRLRSQNNKPQYSGPVDLGLTSPMSEANHTLSMGHGSNYNYNYNAVPFYSPPGSPPNGQHSFVVMRDYGDRPGPGMTAELGYIPSSEPYTHTSNARSQSISYNSGPGTTTSSSEYNRESRHGEGAVADLGSPTRDGRGFGGTGGSGSGVGGTVGGNAPPPTSRKLPVPPRAVTVLQHTDASDVGSRFQEEPPEIVEVPPAYSGNRL